MPPDPLSSREKSAERSSDRPRPPTPLPETQPDLEQTGPELIRLSGATPVDNRSGGGPLPRVPGYEILSELGRGGMGIVYKARQLALKRIVALKMIRGGAVAGPEELARFRVEAETVAQLAHPNIVQIHEVGEYDGLPFFSLEFVGGGSLTAAIRGIRPSPRQAAQLTQTLARAMHPAHQQGIVHRDLKPANVLLQMTNDQCPMSKGEAAAPWVIGHWSLVIPKITDFGLAKLLDDDSGQTRSGAVLGTPSYMAPEQAAGLTHKIGPACDIYALGAILYELLTGRPPFRAATILETLEQVRRQEPVPPRQLNRNAPRDLETICLKCLHKEPHRRYASAEELADDLNRFLEHEPIRARPVGAWERSLKWVRRRPALTLAILVGVLLTGSAAGGTWLWRQREQQRTHREEAELRNREQEAVEEAARKEETHYFTAWVKRRGAPEGVGELTPAQAGRRLLSYRLFSRGGVVQRIDLVNGHGRPTARNPLVGFLDAQTAAGAPGVAAHVFRRDKSGTITAEEMLDAGGQLLVTLHYTSPNTAHYTYRGGLGAPEAIAGYSQFTLNKDGFLETVWNMDRNNKLVPDAQGVYGARAEYDRYGQPIKRTYLNLHGQPVTIADNTAVVTMRYNDRGNQTEEAYFDAGGKAVRRRTGFHKKTMRYDADGNTIEEAYFGVDGQPAADSSGIARRTWRHGPHGDTTEEATFNTAGAAAADDRGVARWTARHDDKGNAIEVAYFGRDGTPATILGGYALVRTRYDDRGNRIEERYFNGRGEPVLLWIGYHRVMAGYDDRGNRTEESFFGLDDQLIWAQAGYARRTMRFDERGRNVEEAYFGVDGRPLVKREGFARVTATYDNLGRPLEGRYFGADGQPVLHRDGYHLVRRSYDERGLQDAEAYFGIDGQPTPHRDGYVRWERSRVAFQGRIMDVWRHFDARGKLVRHRDGYVIRGATTNDRGKVVETAFADAKGAVLSRDGYASWEARYDARGNLTTTSYFDTKKKLVANRDGYAVAVTLHDERGNRTEEAYFGPDKKSVLHKKGFHRARFRYDRLGQPTEIKAFDCAGQPVPLEAFIAEVLPGGLGERLGLHVGDVLRNYDGRDVVSHIWLIARRRLENDRAAAKKLTVLRDGKGVEFSVPPGLLGAQLESRAAPTPSEKPD